MTRQDFRCIYKLDELVARDEFLATIREKINHAQGAQFLFLHGEGGAGKTRILEALLKSTGQSWHLPKEIVDFYDIHNHSASVLAGKLYEVLGKPQEFAEFKALNVELEKKQATGGGGLSALRETVLDRFIKNMKAFSQNHRVLLLLDTVEKLVYREDPKTRQVEEVAESWTWLIETAADWGNVTLLIAGRPDAEGLAAGAGFEKIVLHFLNEPESLAYFEAVGKAAQAAGDDELYARVHQLSVENRKKAHELSNGRPIILALVVDFLSVGDKGGEWRKVLDAQNSEETLEKTLITYLTGLPSFGDTILALGRAPKGVDAALLALLLEIDEKEAKVRLEEVKRFSFIKTPLNGERFFLHDQLYEIMQKWIFNGPHDFLSAVRMRTKIIDSIKDTVNGYAEELYFLYNEKDDDGNALLEDNLERIMAVYTSKRNALTEYVYYLFRQDAAQGFRYYYRYVCEAENAGDISLNVLLQAELSNFLGQMQPEEEGDGFTREFAQMAMEVQTILRLREAEKILQAEQKENRFRKKFSRRSGYPCFNAALQNNIAYTRINSASKTDLEYANKLLEKNLQNLLPVAKNLAVIEKHEDILIWYAGIALGHAYWLRGYLHRNRGEMKDAVKNYRRAAGYFRSANLDIYLSGTLNDQGFALSEDGNWHDAKHLVKEGLGKRMGLGPLVPVGLSLNTLGIVERYEGSYSTAIQYGEQALALFETASSETRQGLALVAVAESYQRLANEMPDMGEVSWRERVDYYHQAIQYAKMAVEIFQKWGWKAREAEAQKELGCGYRNLIAVYRRKDGCWAGDEKEADLVEMSLAALNGRKELTEIDPFRNLEKQINLAYLGYVANDEKIYADAVKKAKKMIPSAYSIDQPPNEQLQQKKLYWTQLGKYHVLLGRHAEEKENDFLSSIPHFAIALECNSRYGLSYPGMSRAEAPIYEKIKLKPIETLKTVREKVEEFEREYHLEDRSYMRRFLVNRSLWYDDDF